MPELGDRWTDRSREGIAHVHRIARLELAALSSIDRARLAPAERIDYDLARRRLELQIEGQRFRLLEPFRHELLLVHQMQGIEGELTGPLGYMPARKAADVERMLGRLRGFPAAVEQAIARLEEGLAAGITPPRVTLRDAPARVLAHLPEDPARAPALQPFQELSDAIPAPERERLRREAARLYAGEVAPALRRLHRYLAETYVPNARTSIAMSDLPDGRAWYAYELRLHTTTDLPPEEIHRLGLAEVARIRQEMDALIAATGFTGAFAEFLDFLRTDPRFYYDDPAALVAGFRDIAKRVDPELTKLFGRLPRLPYGVRALDEGGSKSSPAGFYQSGSLAAGLPGWFLVNTWDLKSRPKWGMEALALHESVPGHHLQYALAEELAIPAWRKWDVYPAFSEGWGLYAEGLGGELGLYRDPYSKFGRLALEGWRAVRMVVDTGIHAFGWSRERALDYYRVHSAKPEHDIVVEVDRIIVQPGTVPAYKLGELKIRELRAHAEKELGGRFDLRAFHDHLLAGGQLPLDLLDERMRGWVSERKEGR